MNYTMRSRLLSLVLTLALLLSLVPAALAAEPGEAEGGVTLERVTLSQETLTLTVGQSPTLTATLHMSDGSTTTTLPEGYTAAWAVEKDRDEVSVTPDSGSLTAVVKALKLADTDEEDDPIVVSVTVTPKDAAVGQTASCQVTVIPDEPQGVTVTP